MSNQIDAAFEESRQLDVQEFKRSEDFLNDLAILNEPMLQIGYTRAMDDVRPLNLARF